MPELPRRDLDHILERTGRIWPEFREARVFITGVTGFIGSWLLESLVHADRTLKLGIAVTALVRNRERFEAQLPHLAAVPGVRVCVGDVRTAVLPSGPFTHMVHCASAASPQMNAEQPDAVSDLIVGGSRRMIELAESQKGARFLQMSSGSVYGPQPASLERIPETFAGEADRADPSQRFGADKLTAERRGVLSVNAGVGFVAARAFATVGPRIPLDGQFAIGNFLADALAGRPVEIRGDGTPVRSWLHAADLTAWSWTILARGEQGAAYNVGSDEALSLGDAAARVAALATPPVQVVRREEPRAGEPASRFVPDVTRAREELGLDAWIPFDEAVRRTWEWYRQ